MSEVTPPDLQTAIAGLSAHPEQSAAEIKQLASTGNIQAQMIYAHLLMDGVGIEKNTDEAIYWYSLAANQGSAAAMNQLGRCHELDISDEANEALAAVWYLKAADQGYNWGMYNYANLLATGRGVKQDNDSAFRWYMQAAQLGHAKSMNLVGRYYEQRATSDNDLQQAFDWYKKSAHAGDFRGQASYAGMLAERGEMKEAVYWMRESIKNANSKFKDYLLQNLGESAYAEFRELQALIKPSFN